MKQQVIITHMMKYFPYNQKYKKEWFPIGNTGLHCSQSLEEANTRMFNFNRLLRRNPRDISSSYLYINSKYEQIISISKVWNHHWLLKNLPNEFKVCCKSDWNAHPINITKNNFSSVRENYRVLIESSKGPQITEHDKVVSLQFDVSPRYKETLIILYNFINNYVPDIYVCLVYISSSSQSLSKMMVMAKKEYIQR